MGADRVGAKAQAVCAKLPESAAQVAASVWLGKSLNLSSDADARIEVGAGFTFTALLPNSGENRQARQGGVASRKTPRKAQAMDLEKLQSKGAIHIGRKSGRMVLYAYIIESTPGRIALGWTRSEVLIIHEAGADEARIAGAPAIKDVLDRTQGRARFLMICHHSSAKELRDKIHAALAVKEMGSTAPEGIEETDQEVWLSARFEDVVFAYPPFAKIFLSECQSAANRDPLSASKNDPLGAPG